MEDYFLNLNKENEHDFIIELEQYALENNVPIVTKEGLELIKLLINRFELDKISLFIPKQI